MLKYSKRSLTKLANLKLSKKSERVLYQAGARSIWLHHTGYAYTKIEGKIHSVHRLLVQLIYGPIPKGFEVDHKNRDRLDNRWRNLRLVLKAHNAANCKKPKSNSTGFKGVHFHKKNKRFVAYIGKSPRVYLGSFKTAELAARAYNKAAKSRYGKYAALNNLLASKQH